MAEYADEVRYILREAGWLEGRHVSTQPYEAVHSKLGGGWSAAAEDFLGEFGGLKPRFLRHDGSVTNIRFDPLLASQIPWFRPAYAALGRQLDHVDLAVLGLAYGDDLLLLMDPEGRVYGAGCDDCLYRVGATGAQALNALFLDQPFELL